VRLARLMPSLVNVGNELARAQSPGRVALAVQALTAARRCAIPASLRPRILVEATRTYRAACQCGPLDRLVMVVCSIESTYTARRKATISVTSTYPSSDTQIVDLGFGSNLIELLVQVASETDTSEPSNAFLLEIEASIDVFAGGAAYLSAISLVPLPLTPPWGEGEL